MTTAEATATPQAARRGAGVGLALVSMTCVQLGAALSDPLFGRVGPAGIVALRPALAALMLRPLARPRLRDRPRQDLGAAVALGWRCSCRCCRTCSS